MEPHLDIDELYRALGVFGRYTKIQVATCLLTTIIVALPLMSFVFIGYRPPYECDEVHNITANSIISKYYANKQFNLKERNFSYSIVYDKCHVTLHWNYSNTSYNQRMECPNGYKYDIPSDRSFVTEWDLVCAGAERSELSQSLLLFGQGVGALIFTQLADKVGRKPIIVYTHICLFLINLSIAFVPHFTVFMILRFFIGALQQGVGLCNGCLYLELFPSEYRYLGEICGLLFWTTGVVLVTPLAYFLREYSWRYTQMAIALCSFYCLFHYWMSDESIRWLMANGKIEEAERIIRKASKINKLKFDNIIKRARIQSTEKETLAEKTNTEQQKTEMLNGNDIIQSNTSYEIKIYTIVDIFRNKRVLLISGICAFAWMTNSLTYYGIMLVSSTLSGNRFLNYFLLAISEYPSAFAEYVLIRRYGRRWACFILLAIAGISLLIACILNLFKDSPSCSACATLSTVFSLIGKFGITGSFSTIFLFTPELYPTNLRNASLGFASTFARVGSILAPFSGTLAERVQWGPGIIFSAMCIIAAILVLFLPETTGRTLPTTIEELNQWYIDHGGMKQKKRHETNQEIHLS